MIQKLTARNFNLQSLSFQTTPSLNKKHPSVLLVKANWCGYCTKYLPLFKSLSERYKSVNFVFVEEEENKYLLNQWANLVNPKFTIKGFPMVILYDISGHPIQEIDRDQLETYLRSMI